MADDKQEDFVDGVSPVTEAFLDRIQEINQGLAWNLNVTISGTSIVIPAGTLENVASIVIKGKMRYISAPVSINFAGFTVGTYGIWANTTSTDSSTPFTIQAVLGSSAPAGVTYTRKIATVYWSGATLQDLTLLAPYTKHASMHRPGGPDPLGTAVVGSNEIMDGAVGTSEIATGSVTPVKLSDELMNRPFLLWEYQNNDVVYIETFSTNSGAIGRGAVLYSSGADEPVGYRTSTGAVVGGTFVDTMHAIVAYYDAPTFSGWNF